MSGCNLCGMSGPRGCHAHLCEGCDHREWVADPVVETCPGCGLDKADCAAGLAWNAAIEKATEVAESADRELSPEEFAKDYLRGYMDGAADVAAAIRALKRGKP